MPALKFRPWTRIRPITRRPLPRGPRGAVPERICRRKRWPPDGYRPRDGRRRRGRRGAAAGSSRGGARGGGGRPARDRPCRDRTRGAARADLARRLSHAECGQRRALCRQGQERPQAARLLCQGQRAPAGPHPAHDRGDRDGRDHLHLDRNRGAAARGQPDQAVAAALQRAAARRQVVSLYPDHRRPLGAADPQASRRADRGPGSISGRSLPPARSIAPSRRCSAPFWCAPAPMRFSKAAPGPACSTRSAAARGPAPARSIFPAIPSWCARPRISCPAAVAPGEAGAGGRNGKGLRRARIRDRGALPRPPRGAVGDPVAAGHQSAHRGGSRRVRHPSGGRLFLRRGVLLPHRAELGQPRLFSARGEIVHAGRGAGLVPGAVLRRQAAAEAHPAVARRSRRASCWPTRSRSRPASRSKSPRPGAARRRNWSRMR